MTGRKNNPPIGLLQWNGDLNGWGSGQAKIYDIDTEALKSRGYQSVYHFAGNEKSIRA